MRSHKLMMLASLVLVVVSFVCELWVEGKANSGHHSNSVESEMVQILSCGEEDSESRVGSKFKLLSLVLREVAFESFHVLRSPKSRVSLVTNALFLPFLEFTPHNLIDLPPPSLS